MEETNDIVINFNSITYNTTFFKKREKKDILLIIKQNYLKYIPSPYDYIMTFKINAIKRIKLFNILIDKIINTVLSRYNLTDVRKMIRKYIGSTIDDVYIEDKSWKLMLYSNPCNYKS